MNISCMKLKYPWMKMKINSKVFLNENSMHEIVYSPISHEHFWGEKIFTVAKFSFSCINFVHGIFMHESQIFMPRFFMHDSAINFLAEMEDDKDALFNCFSWSFHYYQTGLTFLFLFNCYIRTCFHSTLLYHISYYISCFISMYIFTCICAFSFHFPFLLCNSNIYFLPFCIAHACKRNTFSIRSAPLWFHGKYVVLSKLFVQR